jgi:L-2,4-diaminobutyrate decarboxylase
MTSLREAFDPESFRAQAHRVVDLLADYMTRATRGAPMPVLPWVPPNEALAKWPAAFESSARADLDALLARLVRESNHLHHPRYVGHQVAVALPVAAICDFATSVLNNGMAIYETGPVSTMMERSLVRWLNRQLGLGEAADGIFTSGGSVGNLTAVLAARQTKAGFDVWEKGSHAGPPLAVLASDQTHYSIKRSVQIMGWGAGGIAVVPTDARYRMRADALEDAARAAERGGRKVIAVVASAGSTATGAYDPLEPVADFCARRGLWMHVDGAHGAIAALTPKYRALVRGIERADSVVFDAHKMMMMPSLVTAVLFREGKRSYDAFAQEASYLFAGSARREDEWFNGSMRTLECTKRMMGVKLYVALSIFGVDLFAEYARTTFELAARFGAAITSASDFELATVPEGNIVCFRYVPKGASDVDALQARVRQHVVESGAFYLVQTRLRDGLYLRVTLMNPFTTDADLAALLEAVRAAAA